MKILRINQKGFKKAVKVLVELVKQGRVIICPTDTVYGLIADATNKKAVKKIFKIKKRPQGKPIPVFVKDIKMAKKLAEIDKKQENFLKKVWFTRPNFKKGPQKKMVEIAPKIWAGKGKVTVVLKRKEKKQIYGVDKKTIALRIPKYKLVNILLQKLNLPLAGTSANISRKPASTKIKEVINQFTLRRGSGQEKYQPDLIIDAGNLPKNKPSKVLDLTTSPPKVLRI